MYNTKSSWIKITLFVDSIGMTMFGEGGRGEREWLFQKKGCQEENGTWKISEMDHFVTVGKHSDFVKNFHALS